MHDDNTAIDGIKIHYMTLGESGSPVVLVHGYHGRSDKPRSREGRARPRTQSSSRIT